MGRMEPNELAEYIHKCPKAVNVLPGAEIGPTPSTLAGYAGGTWLTFSWGRLLREIAGGRPVVVLVKSNGANLHYQTVVGATEDGSRVAVLDTSNKIEIRGKGEYSKLVGTWLGEAMIVFA